MGTTAANSIEFPNDSSGATRNKSSSPAKDDDLKAKWQLSLLS